MGMEEIAINQRRTIEMLNKLLQAARRAQESGKQEALNKIINKASELGNHLRETMPPEPMSSAEFFKAYISEKKPEFVRVQGIIVD